MSTRINRYLWLVLAAAGLWMLIGCGVDHSPTAPEPAATQTSSGKTYLSFASGPGGHGAAKANSSWDAPSQTKTITPSGGYLKLELKGGEGSRDDLMAMLVVPPEALSEYVAITMTLQGETLEDLVVGFAPEDLHFNIPATLWLKVGKDRVNLPTGTLVALHTSSDGFTQQVSILAIYTTSDAVWIVIHVPGFSVYSLGGGNP